MTASEHLSPQEFPREEVEKWIDPAMNSWDAVHADSKGYIEQVLAPDIEKRGIQQPIQVDRDAARYEPGGVTRGNKIYDGHHRVESARFLGIETIPVEFRN